LPLAGTYGTFLCNTEQQRRELQLSRATVSIWSYVLDEVAQFTNPCYAAPSGFSSERTQVALLRPIASMKRLELWQEYYLRYDRSVSIAHVIEPTSVIEAKQQESLERIRKLEAQLQAATSELKRLQQQPSSPSSPSLSPQQQQQQQQQQNASPLSLDE
jgi:myotubularin-related protein 6/7/8